MADMDASQSALDSLRTVEFRETLKGYHRDDVDEYLEKAAVEAEGLQEQLRQTGERLRQAVERISELEKAQQERPAPEPAAVAVSDDSLQRTLLLAQKFVDETKADAEARASQLLAEAGTKARQMTEEAQGRADQIAADAAQRLREEIARLEETRARLTSQVKTLTEHLLSERSRLRGAVNELGRWVEEHVKAPPVPPEANLADIGRADTGGGSAGEAGERAPTPAPSSVVQGGNKPVGPQAVPSTEEGGAATTGEVPRVHAAPNAEAPGASMPS